MLKGYYLVVFDSYRTLGTQKALYDRYLEELRQMKPDWNDDQLSAETQRFVSLPSYNPTRPSPHNTGGVVDLALMTLPERRAEQLVLADHLLANTSNDEWQHAYRHEMYRVKLLKNHGRLLDFGTPFDYAGPEAAPNYYEKKSQEYITEDERRAMINRRVLYNVMVDSGFESYEEEWWHFNDRRSQMGAKTANVHYAEYGVARLSSENIEHEEMRRNHRLGSIRIKQGYLPQVNKLGVPNIYYQAAAEGVRIVGDMRVTSLPKAAVITP